MNQDSNTATKTLHTAFLALQIGYLWTYPAMLEILLDKSISLVPQFIKYMAKNEFWNLKQNLNEIKLRKSKLKIMFCHSLSQPPCAFYIYFYWWNEMS